MARKIKGITVEIGGDTTKLDKALSDTNKSLGETQRSLKDVERLLKLDPKNVVLLEQKQRLLADAVSDTSKKLETLKTAAEQSGDELKKTAEGTKQYDALQREIAETEQKLKDLEKQQKDTTKSADKLADSFDEVKDKASKLKSVASTASKAIGGIAAAALASVEATEDFRDGMSKLETLAKFTGYSVEDAKKAFEDFYSVTGDTGVAFEAVSNLMNINGNTEQLTTAVDLLSAAVIRFPDTLNIGALADSLQETIRTGEATGQFAELLGRLGVSADEVTASMGQYVEESIKLDIALSALRSNGLNGVIEAWEEENDTLVKSRDAKLELQQTLSELADTVLPLATRVTELATAFLNWFNGLSEGSQNSIIAFGLIVAALGPVANAISGINTLLPKAIQFFGGLDVKTLALAGTLALLATMVVGVIDAWKDMNDLQKIISVLGILATAAAAAAIAVGALQSAWSLGIAAAAIVAGVVAVTAAVNSAKKEAETSAQNYNVPMLADGAVLPPNKPFLAMVGDQRNGTNIEAPMDTIKQGVREVMAERSSGSGGSVTRVEFTGSLAQLGRVLKPVITSEELRAGTSMRK